MDADQLRLAAATSTLLGVSAFLTITLVPEVPYSLWIISLGVLSYGVGLVFVVLHTALVIRELLDEADFSIQSRFEPR